MHYFSYLIFLIFFPFTSFLQANDKNSCQKAFSEIYDNKVWGVNEEGLGYSGAGSDLKVTTKYREFLQKFLADKKIKSVVDYGCGDWTFSRAMNWNGIKYTGIDVVQSVVDRNNEKFGTKDIKFICFDGPVENLPEADLIICKDVLQHLPTEEVSKFLSQLKKYKYALITNDAEDPHAQLNSQIQFGGYRPLDITEPPFSIKGEKVYTFYGDYRSKDIILIDNVTPDSEKGKTVFLTILARNKAHVLDKYLTCIQNQDYDKKLITIYIHTNNNSDNTEQILRDWVKENGSLYNKILFQTADFTIDSSSTPHSWTPERLSVLASIRNESLKKAAQEGSDYYFVVDCDNFISSKTLKHLVEKNKPIIAPMLRSVPDRNSSNTNFFLSVDGNGYFKENPERCQILHRQKIGTFKVPLVHCTYLIKGCYLNHLDYSSPKGEWEFIVFARKARNEKIDQYICNEEVFGTNLDFYDKPTLEQEAERVKKMDPSMFMLTENTK